MNNALFIDVANIIKIKSKQSFPIHREDWTIDQEVRDVIKKYTDLNFKVFLVGNHPNVSVRKREPNPIENLYESIAQSLEKDLKLKANSISFDYCTDRESFDHLPLPGMFYNLAIEHEILLSFSFIITIATLGEFIQTYSSVKPIIM